MRPGTNGSPSACGGTKGGRNALPRYFALLPALLLIATGCGKDGVSGQQPATKPKLQFPVEVEVVQSRLTEFSIQAVGSVEAFEIVPVTARVSGVVEQVLFTEGDRVREHQALLKIEPERFALNVKSAEAQFEKSKAAAAEALAGLARRADIDKKNPGWVSPEELQDWETRVRTLQADSAAALATLELSRLNLRDAGVPAPVTGMLQSRTVRTGQYVQAGTVVATIVRRDPLLLRLEAPEKTARNIRSGQLVRFHVGDRNRMYEAKVIAVTESADPLTRMITITAQVTDSDREELRPGAFAEATIELGESAELPVIPQTAIRPSERGFLAYVIQDTVARERVLELGMRTADGMVEVRNGLTEGEKVVIRGAEALRDGAPVRIAKGQSEVKPADSARRADS